MRVVLDLTSLQPEATGVDRYMKQLVLHLGKIDPEHQYKIFVTYEDRHLFDGMLPRNFTTVPLCLRPRLVRAFFQQIALPVAALRWGADVVHSPVFITPLRRGEQRHVLTVHDMTFFSLPRYHIPLHRNVLYQSAVRWSIRRSHLVIAPSHATRERILELMPGLPACRVRVIPFGVGNEFSARPPEKVREAASRLGLPSRYILYVGTIEPRKNLKLLVESYRRLAGGNFSEHLVLAGRLGWGYAALLKQLDTHELRGRVHLLGYVARFSSCVSTSVSNDCKREVNAAPRSQIFREPMSRKAGSWARRSASLTSS